MYTVYKRLWSYDGRGVLGIMDKDPVFSCETYEEASGWIDSQVPQQSFDYSIELTEEV